MTREAEDLVKNLIATLNKLQEKVHSRVRELYEKGLINDAKIASSISTTLLDALGKIIYNKIELLKFVELSKKFKDSPEELVYLLSLPDIPAVVGSGKRVAESIAGFRGLGIETIDHKIDEVRYEKVSLKEEEHPLFEVSLTSFMYRVPPFELTKCTYERGIDKEITDVLGSRFIWILKPKEVSWDSWNEILKKTTEGKITSLVKGEYGYEGALMVPKIIELIDLSSRSITVEVGGRYPFFIKFGSSIIDNEMSTLRTKEKLLQFLRDRLATLPSMIGPRLASWKLRLDYPYFCYKGLGLSTDPFDAMCPFVNRCWLGSKQGGPCDGRLFWSGKYHKRRFYPKSYPLRRLKVGRGGSITYRDEFPLSLIKFVAYDMKRVESRWYAVEIGTWFINARPTVRIFFDTEIGYTIPTSLIEFSFEREWLNSVIKEVLYKKGKVRRNIAIKFILSKALGKTLDYKRLSKIVKELMNKESKLAEEYRKYIKGAELKDELVDFARRTLLHSLEHILAQYILEKFAGVDMNFILTKYYYKNKSDRIILAENAKNGRIGIVDTIIRVIKDKGLPNFFYSFSNWLTTYLNFHNHDFDKLASLREKEAEKTLTQTISRLERGNSKEQSIADKIRGVCEKVEEFRKSLDASEVDLDITLARTILLAGEIISEGDVEEIGDYFDDILEKYGFKLCLDGCNGCVRVERYCGEGIQQILTTSKMLLYEFTENLRNMMLTGITKRSNELGKYVEPIIFGAKKNLDVLCPYISPPYADKLIQLASRGVKVRVITWMPKKEDKEYEFQKESLRLLKKNLSTNLLVKVEDKPEIRLMHDKTYIADNIVLTGSFNLTESAFYGNFERVEIKLRPETIDSEKKQYEALWEKFADLSKCEIS
ncbi:MAG: phospholipase D-like domain-containing protein [Saccharolobus sp.]|uniref:phospholipase D-like domain-containing protein n=1 Tax=Saccharolobus sp. TaxID=2100761 RepID=UPI00317A8D0C